ncbi:MAG: YafY family transcriptional regulator [Oscillospiraceae bacterium]|nr:YafY family transcriptional regulator [Oscillospiraceae bacterium]
MQINRLFEIVYLLIDKKQMTANDLAAHFEVSKRTILRDIDTLTMAGIPIYTTQGKGGGIFIQDSFVLNKAFISPEEQKQIMFSLQSMAATRLIETNQVLGRLRSFFAAPGKEWIEVDFSRWGYSEIDNKKFELLKHAILNEFAVKFDYLSGHCETKDREVYPLKLSFKSKAWYVQAFCLKANDYRTFKFTRISNMAMLDKPFNSSEYQPPTMDMLEEPPAMCYVDVRVRVSQGAKYRIYDEFEASEIIAHADGTLTLRMPQDAPWISDYILSYGTLVVVLEPQHVVDDLLAHMGKIKGKYSHET